MSPDIYDAIIKTAAEAALIALSSWGGVRAALAQHEARIAAIEAACLRNHGRTAS